MYLRTGNQWHQVNDLSIPNRGEPFDLTRTYNSHSPNTGIFGRKWFSTWEEHLIFNTDGSVSLWRGDGGLRIFQPNGSGGFIHPVGWDVSLSNTGSQWIIRSPQGDERHFDLTGLLVQLKDRVGSHLDFGYFGGRLTSVQDGLGRQVQLSYGSDGFVQTITDPISRMTTYSHDAQGNLIGVGYPGSRQAFYNYTGDSYMVESKDPKYRKGLRHVFYTYDEFLRVVREEDGSHQPVLTVQYDSLLGNTRTTYAEFANGCSSCGGNNAEYDFDAGGVAIGGKDANQNSFTYGHDGDLNRNLSVNAAGQTVTSSFDSNGNLLTQKDPAGNSVTYFYDPVFNQPTTFIDQKGRMTTYSYDVHGNPTTIVAPMGVTTINSYDSFTGDKVSTTDGNGKTTSFGYDAYGNLNSSTDPDFHTTHYQYDAVGRLSTVIDAKNHSTSYTWDDADRLVQANLPGVPPVLYGYDENGNRTSQTDSNGHTTYFTFDGRDRLKSVLKPNGETSGYDYDLAGNPVTITDGRHHHTVMQYDNMNRLLSSTDPLSRVTSYQYDAIGNLTYRTDGKHQLTHYDYDLLNRPVTVTYPDNTKVINTYDVVGNLVARQEKFGTTYFTYDYLNRLIHKRDAFLNDLVWSYDPVGNVISMTYPDSKVVTYDYTPENQPVTMMDNLGQKIKMTYDHNLNLETVQFPNGIQTTYGHDDRNEIQTITSTGVSGSTPLPNITYAYDPAGNPQTITRGSNVSTYGYDFANQLTNANLAYGSPSSGLTQVYIYDQGGNRTSLQENHDMTTYVVDDANQLVSRTIQKNVAMVDPYVRYADAGVLDAPAQVVRTGDSPVKPSAPVGLTAVVTGGKVELTWPASSDVNGYRVFRAVQSGGQTSSYQQVELVQNSGTPSLSFEDDPGSGSWCYALSSFVEKGIAESDMGSSACVTVSNSSTAMVLALSMAQVAPTATPTPIIQPYWPNGPGSQAAASSSGSGITVCGADTSRKLDLMINCGEQGLQDRRWNFLIVNNGSAPLTLQSAGLSLKLWFFEPGLRCLAVTGNNASVFNASGTLVGNSVIQSNVYTTDSSITEVDESSTHKANQAGTVALVYQSGVSVIPAGGWVQGFTIIATSGDSCGTATNWNNFNDDYSGLPNGESSCTGTQSGPFFDDHHFALLCNGTLVQEFGTNGQTDGESGLPPGGGACTPTVTPTFTKTITASSTKTPSPTATRTPTNTPTKSPTNAGGTATPTKTPTWTATNSPTNSVTPTFTLSQVSTFTPTSTRAATPTPTSTVTKTTTPTATKTFTNSVTPTFTLSHVSTFTPSLTLTPTNTPSLTPTNSKTSTPTATPTATATLSPTPSSTKTPSMTPTNTPTRTLTDTATLTPSNTPTNSPTSTPSNTSTATVSPTVTSTIVPTATPCETTLYTYDDNGNLIKEDACGQVTQFAYDFENRLSQITYPDSHVETYLYDYGGNLLRKTSVGVTVTSVYGQGVALLSEKDESTSQYSDYLQIGDKNYEKIASSSVSFFHCDALGSVVALSNTSGVVTDTYEADPFGKLLAHGGTSVNAYQFVGGYGVRDLSSNRCVMGVRLYDAEVGRFTSLDPLGFETGDTNFYRYSGNDSTGLIDPTGLLKTNLDCATRIGNFVVRVGAAIKNKDVGEISRLSKLIGPLAKSCGCAIADSPTLKTAVSNARIALIAAGGVVDAIFFLPVNLIYGSCCKDMS